MLDSARQFDRLPNKPGVGYKAQHFKQLCDNPDPVEWIEVHAENYMGDGGRPRAQLTALSERFALSIHGVGLSIGGEMPLDVDHLKRLKTLCDWAKPASFSEHLAWSTHGSEFLNDLLPLPYTPATLSRVADHINQVQETLGRKMLLENPSSYLVFADSSLSETDFISEVVNRTSCGLLLDVNNVFISSVNLGISASHYVDTFPVEYVCEIHVGGHDAQTDDTGRPLLIDTHGQPVDEPVWELLKYTLGKTGPKPVLVEWDNDVPDWPMLQAETKRVAEVLAA